MYRLVLYYLIGLWFAAIGLSHFGFLPYDPPAVIASGFFIIGVCLLLNEIFARIWRVPTNVESVYITALILTLIITPLYTFQAGVFIETALWASVFAIASKYILVIKKKHIFNPAALGVVATGLLLGQPASWWVGTATMAPFVLLGGILMIRKIQRADLFWSFTLTALVLTAVTSIGANLGMVLSRTILEVPLLFFAFVMLTEPLTTPPTRPKRIAYGALVGIMFAPATNIAGFYFSPELALILGNVFSYIVSPKEKLVLKLKEKIQTAPDMYDFVFAGGGGMRFRPGQYMEWTLGHERPDSRGNRRYFTLASSPTERDLRLGIRFYDRPSSFKKALLTLRHGGTIVATGLAGDFTMPKEKTKKMVFIAGGIGITPFRSMIKYLTDNDEKRDIVLLYSNRSAKDIIYNDVFTAAEKRIGLKVVHTLTETAPKDWPGEKGRISAAMISRQIPDWRTRTFYISGTHAMVAATEKVLREMGVPGREIKTDFFPGFA